MKVYGPTAEYPNPDKAPALKPGDDGYSEDNSADVQADPSRLSLEELNARTAAAGAGLEFPSQMDAISSANDAPPSRQEFVSLLARVILLEENSRK